MLDHAASHFGNGSSVSAQETDRRTSLKYLSNSTPDYANFSRKWFAELLWKAFPDQSESAIAERAARVLDVSPRQVRNWLRCNNDASLRHVMAVMAVAGAEIVFRKIEMGP